MVRRTAETPRGLSQLPRDAEDLAAGRSEYLRRERRPTGRIEDPRIAGLIPGVPNHEARQVFDHRVARMRAALGAEDEVALQQLLHDAVLLGMWRARNVQGLDALCEGVIGMRGARAEELVKRAVAARGQEASQMPEAAVALWMRGEAALLTTCDAASIEVRSNGDTLQIQLSVPLGSPEQAADALMAVGHNARGLGQALIPERRTKPINPRDR